MSEWCVSARAQKTRTPWAPSIHIRRILGLNAYRWDLLWGPFQPQVKEPGKVRHDWNTFPASISRMFLVQSAIALAAQLPTYEVPGLTITAGIVWWFPKIRGPFLGVFILGIMVYWGLFWGPYFGKLPYRGQGTITYHIGSWAVKDSILRMLPW